MSLSKNTLKLTAATGAVALAFGAMAPAFADGAGLINDSAALNRYTPALSKTMAAVTGDDLARMRAGGFMVDLETALRAPADKPRIVDYPPRANADLLRITAVVPPRGGENLPIPFCAEQFNKVLYTGVITPKGEVVPVTGNWAKETTTHTACKEFILAARNDINTKLAQPNAPSQPPPQQAEQKAISKPSASLATATPNG
ncbi:MAG: hypothetical protein RKP46_16335 [Candidatus Accumulibacter sp.]|uniref:hypothetical protein n=1 Tax=Accumulibacter sp. TaxID=2053492 RepID=UPI00287A11E4|nr:hypothetical protein [Accumulibacter sp.]MDS4015896.1 hypothetical protein [Accumulibacter sp.]